MNDLFENIDGVKEAEFKKNERIVSVGQKCKNLYFIERGLVKLSSYRYNNEFILNFFWEDHFFTVIDSFLSQDNSDCEISAIENTKVRLIGIRDLEKICRDNHRFENSFRKLTEKSSVNLIKRVKELLTQSPEMRYSNFLKNYPEILQRISLGDTAKYIGISQVSLSRIRAKK